MSAGALLPRAMGAAFERLPLAIRAMHGTHRSRRAVGRVDVSRGHGRLARALAGLLRLPEEGRDQPITVDFTALPGRERWTRRIGARGFATVLQAVDGVLLERVNGLTVCMRAVPIDGGQFDRGVALELVRAWFCGIPLPRAVSPCFIGRMRAPECLYRFEVAVAFPLIGDLIRYDGWLAPPEPVEAGR